MSSENSQIADADRLGQDAQRIAQQLRQCSTGVFDTGTAEAVILSALQQAQPRPEIEALRGLVALLKREVKQVEDWLATLPIQQAGPVRLRDIRDALKRLEAAVAAPTTGARASSVRRTNRALHTE